MTPYQLTKLVALAGTLSSRKRVQKVIHLLQCAGCPLDAEHRLHLYGPYSASVANLLNDLVRQGVLVETCERSAAGELYSYTLSGTGRAWLADHESTVPGRAAALQLRPFEDQVGRLATADLWELELASTVAFYWTAVRDWERAAEQAATFKQVPPDAPVLAAACRLAQAVVVRGGSVNDGREDLPRSAVRLH